MLYNPHPSSHTNKWTQNTKAPRHHNNETTWGVDRVGQLPPNLSNKLWGPSKYRLCGEASLVTSEVNMLWCWYCPPGQALQQNAPSPMTQRMGFPTGCLSKSSRAEGWVGGVAWADTGIRGPEALCLGQGYFHRAGNTLPLSLDFLHCHPFCPILKPASFSQSPLWKWNNARILFSLPLLP